MRRLTGLSPYLLTALALLGGGLTSACGDSGGETTAGTTHSSESASTSTSGDATTAGTTSPSGTAGTGSTGSGSSSSDSSDSSSGGPANACEEAGMRILAAVEACGYETGMSGTGTGDPLCTDELAALAQCYADCYEQADCGANAEELGVNVSPCLIECTGDTGETEGDSTAGTTGGGACMDIVGSQDCEALAAVSPDLTLERCQLCQGIACGQEPDECDGEFPCVDGAIVVQGCCADSDCEGLAQYCGMFTGTNNVCVLDDDI
ncbi:MAG: hypothetical protein H6713_15385 [Myxococcales bacterium]|nr:hypothetical protein [Myxococcales bacterium]